MPTIVSDQAELRRASLRSVRAATPRAPVRHVRPARNDRPAGARAPLRPTSRIAPKTLRTHWRAAFAAAEAALSAAKCVLPPEERRELAQRLAAERESTAQLLRAHSRVVPAPSFRLLPPREARQLLGLPQEVAACVFNLDGVLIGSAAIHAEAWAKTFDRFLSRRDRTRELREAGADLVVTGLEELLDQAYTA
jgi:hypothetical protein